MRLHFTELAVGRLQTPGTYYDTSLPAFGIRVGKNRKTWFVIRGKKRMRSTIGRYSEHLTLAAARKEAKKLLAEPEAPHSGMKFEPAYEAWKVAIEGKKERTQRDYKRLIDKHFLPELKKKKLPDLTYEDVTGCVDGVSKGEADHALVVARIFLRWCIRPPRRYMRHNPLEGVQIAPSKKRKRVLPDQELRSVWDGAIEQGYPHGHVVRLLILTGQRRGEIANLRWPWINEKERTILLPDWLNKNSQEHLIPYGQMTADILATIPRLNSTDLLFPSRVSDERPISGWSKYKHELDELYDIEPFRLHDLRRTFRTSLGKLKVLPHIAERYVNHVSAQTDMERTYDLYGYLPELREACSIWEEHLTKVLAA